MAIPQIKKALMATAFVTAFTAVSGTAIAADGYTKKFGDNKTSLEIGNHYYGSPNYGRYGNYGGHRYGRGTLSFEVDLLGSHHHGRVYVPRQHYWRQRDNTHYFNSLPRVRHQFDNHTHSQPEHTHNSGGNSTTIIYDGPHGVCDVQESHQHKKATPQVK